MLQELLGDLVDALHTHEEDLGAVRLDREPFEVGAAAALEPNTSFIGRLATYRYYNMDQIVGQALATFRRLDLAPAQQMVEAAE
mgnify:CR=1 FL=1